jgi:hypothetical protein
VGESSKVRSFGGHVTVLRNGVGMLQGGCYEGFIGRTLRINNLEV